MGFVPFTQPSCRSHESTRFAGGFLVTASHVAERLCRSGGVDVQPMKGLIGKRILWDWCHSPSCHGEAMTLLEDRGRAACCVVETVAVWPSHALRSIRYEAL